MASQEKSLSGNSAPSRFGDAICKLTGRCRNVRINGHMYGCTVLRSEELKKRLSQGKIYHELGPAVNKTSHPTLTIMFLQISCCSVDEHYLGRVILRL